MVSQRSATQFYSDRRCTGSTDAADLLPNIEVITGAPSARGYSWNGSYRSPDAGPGYHVSFNPTRSIIADVTPGGKERTKGYTRMQTISGYFWGAGLCCGRGMGTITC